MEPKEDYNEADEIQREQMLESESFDNDDEDFGLLDSCPNCGNLWNERDIERQRCSFCGYPNS